MPKLLRHITLTFLLAVAGCAPFILVPTGQKQDIRSAFTIDVYRPWNRLNPQAAGADLGPLESWTIDGPGLDQLLMIVGVSSGEPLFKPARTGNTPPEPLPPYRAGMTPNEVMELYESSLAKLLQTAIIEAKHLQPTEVGDSPGFRFDYAYVAKDNIERRGVAFGTVRGDRLYLFAFHGPRIHHFPAFGPEVERMFASIRFAETPRR